MDDLVGNPNPLIGKLLSGLVSDLHSSLNAPAETVRLGEFHGDGSPGVLQLVLLQRLNDITGVLAVHELEGLFLVAKPSAIVVLASRQVLTEQLGVEVGLHGRGGGVAGASDGERAPAAKTEASGMALGREEIGAGRETAEVESDRHRSNGDGEGDAWGKRERVMMTGTGDLVKFVLSYFVSNNVLHEYFVVSIYLFWLISRWGLGRFGVLCSGSDHGSSF